jgi:hypothetical protein
VQSFRDIYKDEDMSREYVETEHHSEVIPTLVAQMRNNKVKFESSKLNASSYDIHNSYLLMALEPLIVNNHNLQMAMSSNMTQDAARVMMEQQMPSEVA